MARGGEGVDIVESLNYLDCLGRTFLVKMPFLYQIAHPYSFHAANE